MSSDRALREYVISALDRYWPQGRDLIAQLPIPAVIVPGAGHHCVLIEVQLPEWCADTGVNGKLLVPDWVVIEGDLPVWQRVDWYQAVLWYLNGTAERALEAISGPVHSYSYRLPSLDSRMWERAWVNRIALFLRRWAAYRLEQDETVLFGPRPIAEIILTHDVDAVVKTFTIRGKQTAFHLYNCFRLLLCGQFGPAWAKASSAAKFLFSCDDYWRLDELAELEEKHGVRSLFTLYGGFGSRPRNWRSRVIDPDYDVCELKIRETCKRLLEGGWQFGLHPSSLAWHDYCQMAKEKALVEKSVGVPVTTCRQHWLFFSWATSWVVQESVGLSLDMTLGFNDRPGFRTASALRYHPWDTTTNAPRSIEIVPMVLMDSHLYDYASYGPEERKASMLKWLDEVKSVGGVASIIWHPHAMSPDYGWADGYKELLSSITRSQ